MNTIEERVKRLEEIVAPEDQDVDIGEALFGVYSAQIHSIITLCDFLFDSSNALEILGQQLSMLIPEEIKSLTPDDEPSLRLVTDEQDTAGG